MIIGAFVIAKSNGDLMLQKSLTPDLSNEIVSLFWRKLAESNNYEELPLILEFNQFQIIHIPVNSLYFLVAAQNETDVVSCISFFEMFNEIVKSRFSHTLTQELINKEYITLMLLLDEMLFGDIMITDSNQLLELYPSKESSASTREPEGFEVQTRCPSLVSNSSAHIPWRRQNVSHDKNKALVDVVERYDAVIDSHGIVTFSSVNGNIAINSLLSGQPDVLLRLKNPSCISSASFHPSVRYIKWQSQRVLSFVPPDGKFSVMRYQINGNTQCPISIKPKTQRIADDKIEFSLSVSPNGDFSLQDVFVKIPFNHSSLYLTTVGNEEPVHRIINVDVSSDIGSSSYNQRTHDFEFSIAKLPSNGNVQITGTITFIQLDEKYRDPLDELDGIHPAVTFLFTKEGDSVLKVNKMEFSDEYGGNLFKGVKYKTLSGQVEMQL
ncbi:hypothetical protein PCE1_000805 [Barthelona sp. PCE]